MRLIDADKLKAVWIRFKKSDIADGGGFVYDPDDVIETIDESETIEAEPVKHGRWIEDRYYEKPCVCSYCGAEAHYISTFKETYDYDREENLQSTGFEEICEYIKTDYCPNCGAKMDLEE